ncbi:hypothetical protein FQA39_LY02660 [Lamprigera yunnana]|nr:hypothetical protein FQA39_LY02660 [Lamprigera yunnana]
MCVWLTRSCVFIVVVFGVTGDNITDRFLTMGHQNSFQTKQNRLLQFHTDTEGEISIEMQFGVPFITIPVNKAMDATKGAIAKINVAALVVSAVIAIMSGFILPAIVKLLSNKYRHPGFSRDIKSESMDVWRILMMMDQTLIENNLDTTSCMQRFVCWAIQTSVNKIPNGQEKNVNELIDGLLMTDFVSKIVDGTPIQSAIRNGLNGTTCERKYEACKISQHTFVNLLKRFSSSINLT